MGDRVAEYLGIVIMLVAVVATIALGASVMGLSKKMFYNFSEATNQTYNSVYYRTMEDAEMSDGLVMPAAAALSFLYENQRVIWNVYDNRNYTEKTVSTTGSIVKISHRPVIRQTDSPSYVQQAANISTIGLGQSTRSLAGMANNLNTDSTLDKPSDERLNSGTTSVEPDARYADKGDKMKQAIAFFDKNLGKSCKITVKRNIYYPDYFDVWIHDADCQAANKYHDGLCKWCTKHPTGQGDASEDCVYEYRK
jgi:hypothetical protein